MGLEGDWVGPSPPLSSTVLGTKYPRSSTEFLQRPGSVLCAGHFLGPQACPPPPWQVVLLGGRQFPLWAAPLPMGGGPTERRKGGGRVGPQLASVHISDPFDPRQYLAPLVPHKTLSGPLRVGGVACSVESPASGGGGACLNAPPPATSFLRLLPCSRPESGLVPGRAA